MLKVSFIARCGEESLPITVEMPFKPGQQAQRARRLAVGHLLAALEVEQARVTAEGDDLVTVATPDGTWVIAEGRAVDDKGRGRV